MCMTCGHISLWRTGACAFLCVEIVGGNISPPPMGIANQEQPRPLYKSVDIYLLRLLPTNLYLRSEVIIEQAVLCS